MKNQDPFFEQCDLMCKVIVHPIRMKIIQVIGDGELNVSEILEQLDISMSNLSNHLRELHRVGLLIREKRGNFIYYSLMEPQLIPALQRLKEVISSIASKVNKMRMNS